MQYLYFMLGLSIWSWGGVVYAEGKVSAPAANEYPPAFVRGYNQECIATSIEEGLEEGEAQRLCSCTLAEFQRQYELEEFQQLTNASATDESAQGALVEVGQLCFEKILYEE